MRIKVLMAGAEMVSISVEAQILKERGFLVYTCNVKNVEGMIDEITPDVIYINPQNPNANMSNVYHHLLDNAKYVKMPVIYSLLEDDMYIVNSKRAANNNKQKIVCDNIVDAIKTSIIGTASIKRKKSPKHSTVLPFRYYTTSA